MPGKRTSFFDKLTTVINPSARSDDREEVEEEQQNLRVEVPKSAQPRSHRAETQVPVSLSSGGDDETGQLLVDLYEADGNIVVQAMIAGVTPENLQIAITRERLTIRGKREMPKEEADAYHLSELYWGSFERVIDLPYEVDPDGADAVEKYGLLIIRLPKLDTDRIQELRVKSV